jgi:TPR repeat protein
LLAALVLPGGVWAALQQLGTSSVWSASSATLAAIAPLVVAEIKERKARRDEQREALSEHVRSWPSSGERLLGDVKNPIELGIKPSAIGLGGAHLLVPPYVERTKDEELRKVLQTEQFVMVVGDSTAGKSRSAFEMARELFPDRRLVVPSRRDSLIALLRIDVDLRNTVIWLDDLEGYLGPDGLTVDVLERLLNAGDGSITILGTMRAAAHEQYASRANVTKPERKVLERARTVRIRQKLELGERERARKQFADPNLDAALDRFGLGEYLAAGPELVDRFENGSTTCPIGRAIVQASIDWRRVGMSRAIPMEVLKKLYSAYREEFSSLADDADTFENGLNWAGERIFATTALMSRQPDGYLVFDYMLDYVERERRDEIPRVTWEVALSAIDSASEALDIGVAAYTRRLLNVAEQALRLAVTSESIDVAAVASFNLAVVLNECGKLEEAEHWYRRAAVEGHAGAASNLGRLLEGRGELVEAGRLYRQAAEAGNSDASYHLARMEDAQNRKQTAMRWLLQAASAGHSDAAHDLARILEKRGDVEEAEGWYRRAVAEGHAGAASNLGRLLEGRGELVEAGRLYRQAAEAGNSDASYHLARMEDAQNRKQTAMRWLLQAALAGNPDAAFGVGSIFEDREEWEKAERWFRRAAEAGNADAAYELGAVLARRENFREAEEWFRRGAESGNANAAYELGVILLERQEIEKAKHWWRVAADGGNDKAALYLNFLTRKRRKKGRL